MTKLTSYSMSFHGDLLKRGFWLYVWDIRTASERHLYVGRTGDSSSCNAASPFQRIGQHLDSRANAKGNALAKQLKKLAADPALCAFDMTAIGPLFPEQADFEAHKPIRDRVVLLKLHWQIIFVGVVTASSVLTPPSNSPKQTCGSKSCRS